MSDLEDTGNVLSEKYFCEQNFIFDHVSGNCIVPSCKGTRDKGGDLGLTPGRSWVKNDQTFFGQK